MKRLKFMDPQQIIAIVVSLIVLAVGIFAFFTVTTNVQSASSDVPVGNNMVLSTNKAIQGWTGAPVGNYLVFIPVSADANNVTITKLEALNATTLVWTEFHCDNGTFISGNDTYRVSRRTVNGSTDWTYFRLTYNVPGSATTGANNMTWKALNNNSYTGGQVFNIVGIVIMIGAIMSIIGIIYSYLRPY